MMWVWIGVGVVLAWGMVALKSAVVLGLLRNALGAEVPPPAFILIISGVLSLVVLAPVIEQTRAQVGGQGEGGLVEIGGEDAAKITQPLQAFLGRNCAPEVRVRFAALAVRRGQGSEQAGALVRSEEGQLAEASEQLEVLAPAFIASELSKAFQIGFLIILPFIVVDLLMGVALVGGGLKGLPPQAIALPLKLIIFVGADGWSLLIESLLSGYL